MTSPYLERPCRPLEEAKRQVGPRNWGVPPQTTHDRCTFEELSETAKAAERFDTWGEEHLGAKPTPLPLFDRVFILAIAGALGLSAGLLFLLALTR